MKQITFSLIAVIFILLGCYEFSQGKLTGLIYFIGCVLSLAIAEQEFAFATPRCFIRNRRNKN